MKSNLKIIIKIIIFFFINISISPSKKISKKTILLIRLDAIGDYILFRNFIQIIANSKKYQDYKITLVGNSTWKNIAENLDSQHIDSFIWLDRNKLNKDFIYRYQKLKEISSFEYLEYYKL